MAKNWVSTHFLLKVFGSMISPTSPVGNVLTIPLVDTLGNVVCITSYDTVRVHCVHYTFREGLSAISWSPLQWLGL